jgi:hypothetical protein
MFGGSMPNGSEIVGKEILRIKRHTLRIIFPFIYHDRQLLFCQKHLKLRHYISFNQRTHSMENAHVRPYVKMALSAPIMTKHSLNKWLLPYSHTLTFSVISGMRFFFFAHGNELARVVFHASSQGIFIV